MIPPEGGLRAQGTVSVATLVVGSLATNCYVLRGRAAQAGTAIVIDPGGEAGKIIDYLEGLGVSVDTILLTHGHSDHISAVPELLARWPDAAVGVSFEDHLMLGDAALNLSAFVGVPVEIRPRVVRRLAGGDRLELQGVGVEVIASPGHTSGGLSYYLPSPAQPVLFSGDTLFAGSVGRTDLPGGSAAELSASLKRLVGLPPQTVVYPGHGQATSIRAEIRGNPYLIRLRGS